MKRLVLMIVSALICGIVFTSCSKVAATDDNPKVSMPIEEGTYSGIFTVKYSANAPKSWKSGSGTVTLELKDGQFICKGENTGGEGIYTVNDNKITFVDMVLWHFIAGSDHNVMLDGEYDYTFDGKRLKISANKNKVGHYVYDLKKQ